ncbi:hypothetical protein VPNG_00911 [Cytospora leucostoma]|uniref:Uncharacterized protein n=1 Tax=Cytospora leucostoma TaxID=1230097 RepID=A0A423XMC6_9PEZI|nr:hypothetical protein VPNG_00911 [Cytospora leucostoma]
MDAQNAAESAATKPAASTPASPRPCNNTTEPESSNKLPSSAAPVNRLPPASTLASSTPLKEAKPSGSASHQQGQDDDTVADNSEAETIVLGTGSDGSPIKSRKVIKREDGSDRDERRTADGSPSKRKSSDGKNDGHGPKDGRNGSNSLATDAAKRKRFLDHPRKSEFESAHPTSSKGRESGDKDGSKARLADRLVPHKRKAPKADSEDDADTENHRIRRQRTSASIDASSMPRLIHKDRDYPKLTSSKTNADQLFSPRRRSISPHPRTHRRSASTQVVSQSSSGLSHKKKRVPPPLTTDYHSDESSTSGSPHIRSTTIRGLATPATAESTMSSAKSTAHKKHVDAHGQTQLAKACSRGEYENVKRRLHERPQDLNFPDYAGNTPLQIAAINGYDDIVKLLVEAGCDIDCVNHDKDTPLLDAVDNGHLDVVKVLLDAGVNPRKANVNGEEPLDRVDDDLDNAEEIRAALTEARKKMGERRRTSEEQQDHLETRSYGPDSPRRSPAVNEPSTSTRRAASSRSHKLSNQVLYMHMDDKTLRQAAGRGDVETVERILQVRDNFDDAEAMVAAARGGHETVMNLLLALGNANPDPSPVAAWPPDIATPILAAIGQENIRVIKLLLAQSNFDPTRKFRGETYHEIAQKRQGPNWKEEEHILKEAYDDYKRTHRDPLKKSPNRREHEAKRSGRFDSKDESARALKRKATSPTRDGHRITAGKSRTGEKEPRATSTVGTTNDDMTDGSRDRLSVSGDSSGKRSRISATPDHGSSEKEGEPPKKRRLEGDKKDRLPKPSSSPDRNRKSTASRDALAASKHDDKASRKHDDNNDKRDSPRPRNSDSASDHSRGDAGNLAPVEKSIHVKSEDADVVMKDADNAQDEESKSRAAREKEDEKRRRAELEAKKKEKEAEERKRREEDEEKRRQAETKKREEEEKEKKRLEEEERKRREEEARKHRVEAERLQKQDEERRRQEEEKRRLEKEKEEGERKKREEQERIRKEQEAAEQARRKREEEERREQERREREEQRRALREAELRKLREEQERARLEKLPAFLRWLDRGSDTRTPETAKRFRILTGVRYDSIRPEAAGTEEGRELWVINSQAALLLGESDLRLSRFPSWDRVPASEAAKYVILGKKRPTCGLIDADEWDLGRQLPGYYFGKEPELLSFKEKQQLQEESKSKFQALDLFFVKLSDLMFFIPNIPHLRNLEIVVMYEEIPETVEQYEKGEYPSRWKSDPDAERYMGFCPRNKYYVNGQLVREGKVDINNVSKTPWPEHRVPRDGLTAVSPTNPNYVRLAKEQGLGHLLSGLRTPPMTTAAHTSPNPLFSQPAFQGSNDGLSPPSEFTATASGDGQQPRSSTASTAEQDKPLVNGHNGHTESIGAGGDINNH